MSSEDYHVYILADVGVVALLVGPEKPPQPA